MSINVVATGVNQSQLRKLLTTDKSRKAQQSITLLSALLLSACSSGSSKKATVPVVPDFRENPSGTFTATSSKDNNILNRPSDSRDLTVYGGAGIDQITTGNGADTIEGRGGNDTITSGAGDDIIEGGTGNDTIGAAGGDNVIHGDEGDDIISAGAGGDSLHGDAGNDTITSSGGADYVTGSDGDDTITLSGDGNDIALGGVGNDSITTADGDDIIVGGFGNDTINTGGGIDYIWPSEGVDITDAGAGDDYILIIGITEEDQFSEVDLITLSVLGFDSLSLTLAAVLAFVGINGRTVSELEPGEVIDGGEGTNTLIIYGDTDLTVATLINLYEINIVEGSVGVSSVQIADFGAISSDENSTVNIIADENGTTIDLSTIDITNLGEMSVPNGITLTMHDISDIQGISRITASGDQGYTVEIIAPEGVSQLDVSLSELAATMTGVSVIDLGPNVTLLIDSIDDVAQLGLTSIIGAGEVIFDSVTLSLDELAELAADLSLDDALVIIGLFTVVSPMLLAPSMTLDYQGAESLSPDYNSDLVHILDTVEMTDLAPELAPALEFIAQDHVISELNYDF